MNEPIGGKNNSGVDPFTKECWDGRHWHYHTERKLKSQFEEVWVIMTWCADCGKFLKQVDCK
jgi:hypothetical protein